MTNILELHIKVQEYNIAYNNTTYIVNSNQASVTSILQLHIRV